MLLVCLVCRESSVVVGEAGPWDLACVEGRGSLHSLCQRKGIVTLALESRMDAFTVYGKTEIE